MLVTQGDVGCKQKRSLAYTQRSINLPEENDDDDEEEEEEEA